MTRQRFLRRVLLLVAPTAVGAPVTSAQDPGGPLEPPPPGSPDEIRLPNGKRQRDAILKADYEQNLKDAQELVSRSRDFELQLEKSDQYVLSLDLLKQLNEIEKTVRRIRGRMRRV